MKLLEWLFRQTATPPEMSTGLKTYRIGSHPRCILAMHKKVEANANRDTPGAQRMREVVAKRARQWEAKG